MVDTSPESGSQEPAGPEAGAPVDREAIRQQVVDVLKTCYDPEIPVDIYELGLVYDIDVADDGAVAVNMTLTSPACPVAGTLPPEVEHRIAALPPVTSARVNVVWEPPWTPDRMSEAAKLQLNMF